VLLIRFILDHATAVESVLVAALSLTLLIGAARSKP